MAQDEESRSGPVRVPGPPGPMRSNQIESRSSLSLNQVKPGQVRDPEDPWVHGQQDKCACFYCKASPEGTELSREQRVAYGRQTGDGTPEGAEKGIRGQKGTRRVSGGRGREAERKRGTCQQSQQQTGASRASKCRPAVAGIQIGRAESKKEGHANTLCKSWWRMRLFSSADVCVCWRA